MKSLYDFLSLFDASFIWYFASIDAVYLILFFIAAYKVFMRREFVLSDTYMPSLRSNFLPSISFLMPAYNEQEQIVQAVKNVLAISYRHKQIIVINDASNDETLERLIKAFDLIPIPKFYQDTIPTKKVKTIYKSKLHPELLCIDKEHGKKFDTLNVGINACETPFFISLDADTFLDDQEFEFLIHPILQDPSTLAIGASIRIVNGCSLKHNTISTLNFPQRLLPAIQNLEYLRAFLQRQGWDFFGGVFVLSGAFAIFNAEVVKKIGGYVDTVAEDMEIILRLHRWNRKEKRPYKITYLPDPVAWTLCPETYKELSHQRKNWHRGMLDCLWYHRQAFFNPKYGFFGLFVYPFWVYGECLEPLVEIMGHIFIVLGYFLGVISLKLVLLFLAVTWGFTALFTVLCVLVEELSFRKYPSIRSLVIFIAVALCENLWYRQLTLLWRFRGTVEFCQHFRKAQENKQLVEKLLNQSKQQGDA